MQVVESAQHDDFSFSQKSPRQLLWEPCNISGRALKLFISWTDYLQRIQSIFYREVNLAISAVMRQTTQRYGYSKFQPSEFGFTPPLILLWNGVPTNAPIPLSMLNPAILSTSNDVPAIATLFQYLAVKTSLWLTAVYKIYIHHSSGECIKNLIWSMAMTLIHLRPRCWLA